MKKKSKKRKKLSQRGQAVSDTYHRRRGRGKPLIEEPAPEAPPRKKKPSARNPSPKKPKTAAEKSQQAVNRNGEAMKPDEFHQLMEAIGKVINSAISNLAGEFKELNADMDVGGATQLMGRSATLCVVAQVFDLLLATMNRPRKIQLTRLATLSRILVDQRREERQSPSLKDGATKSGEAHCNADQGQLNGLVQEVYGAASKRDDKPPAESRCEPSSASTSPDVPTPAVGAPSVDS